MSVGHPSDESECVLVIDLGTSGPKIALVSVTGEILDHRRLKTSLYQLPAGGAEQDAEEWWRIIDAGVRDLQLGRSTDARRIISVAVCTQWSVTIPVNENGYAVGPAISWLDGRGGKYSRQLMTGWPSINGLGLTRLIRWLRRTGGIPMPSGADALSHILFLKHERPDIYKRAHWLLEPMDFLGLRLTGRCATSSASAFAYMLADTRRLDAVRYCPDLMRLADVDGRKLPEILPVNTVLGTLLPAIAQDWGIPASTPVTIGSGDSHVAIIASGAVKEGEIHLSMGTSCSMSCFMSRRRWSVINNLTSIPAVVPDKYMAVAELGMAGKTLEMFVERWFATEGSDSYLNLLDAAEAVSPACDGMIFLPFLAGSGPPASDPLLRGAFLNLTYRCGPQQIIRAVLEGISCQIRWLTESLESFIGKPTKEIRVVGGASISAIWCQIIADVLNRRIVQVADPQFSIARGAAFTSLIHLGRWKIENVADHIPIGQTFSPNPQLRWTYDDLYRRFHAARKATRSISHDCHINKPAS